MSESCQCQGIEQKFDRDHVARKLSEYRRRGPAATTLGGRGVELRLGDHEVADRIRELGVSTRALASSFSPAGRLIMPAPRAIGPARDMEFYRGSDAWFGRYTIQYPGTDPVDQYAYLARPGIERTITRAGGRVLEEYASIDADLARAAEPLATDEGALGAHDRERVAGGRGD